MKTTCLRALSQRLVVTFCVATLGILCGCGSGSGLSGGGSPGAPTPVASTNGPQLGYFWNTSDATLRPVLGIPGASQVGQSVVPAGTYANASASSASAIAVLQETDGSLDIMPLPSGQPMHLSAATTPGAQIRFSPNGKSALVFTPGSASITLLTGLNSNPSASIITATAAPQEAALADSGNIAIATTSANGISISIVDAKGATTSVGSVGALGGMAFAGADSLLFADAAANTLTLIRNASTSPAPALVPTTSLLKTPSALGVSTNGQWVLVTNSADPSAVRVDLTAQTAPLRIACNCTPTLVAPLAGAGTFRVTAPGTGPLWAMDVGISTPRAFFIPATAVHP